MAARDVRGAGRAPCERWAYHSEDEQEGGQQAKSRRESASGVQAGYPKSLDRTYVHAFSIKFAGSQWRLAPSRWMAGRGAVCWHSEEHAHAAHCRCASTCLTWTIYCSDRTGHFFEVF